MARKKLLAMAIGGLMPIAAQALTLDQIKVGSLLDQPLKAAIAVTADTPAEIDSLRVGLAPAGRFAEQGIPRVPLLEELSFQVYRTEPGSALVLVTTAKPVNEPFLDFLVEAKWDTGQVTRGYTVLLDPPYTVDSAPPSIDLPAQAVVQKAKPQATPGPAPKPPVAEQKPEPVAEQKPEPAEAAPATLPKAEPRPAPVQSKAPAAVAGKINVREGDTLWSLAKSVRPRGATVYQTLNALYIANPNAFLDNNVNLMLEGSILRVPPKEEILALDQGLSERLLAEHTRAWQPGRPATAGASSGETGSPEVAAGTGGDEAETASTAAQAGDEAPSDRLQLASAGTSAAAAAGEQGAQDTDAEQAAEQEQLQQELVQAREDAVTARQEANDLRDRLADLESRLTDTERLVELKDEQLARLQAYYAEQEAQEASSPEDAAGEAVPDDAIAAETVAGGPPAATAEDSSRTLGLTLNLDERETPAEEAADSAPVTSADEEGPTKQEPPASEAAGEEVADTAAEVTAESGEPAGTDEAGAGEEMVDTAASAQTSPVQAAEPAGGEPQETQPSEPVADKPAPAASGSALDDIPIMPVVGGVAIAGLLGLLVLLRRRRNEIEPEPVVPAAAVPAGPVSLKESVPSVDARLSALDQLIAARDWDAARGVAEELHATNPERPDITGKLLSSLHGAGDGAAFTDLAKKLVFTGFAADHPDLWGRVEQMGRELMPSEELFAASAAAADDAEEDLDEMLDTLETRIDSADDELRREAADVLGEAATHLEPADAGRDEVDEWQEQDSTLEIAGVAPLSEEEVETPVAEIPEPVGEPVAAMPDVDLESTAAAPVGEPEQGTDTIEFETVALSPDDMVADEAGAEAEAEPREPEDMIEFDLDQLALGEEQGPGEEEQGVDEAEALTPNEAAAVELDNIIALHGQESEEGPTEEKELPDGLVAGGASEEDVQTKLDLARAFLDLGDSEGARGILEEVVVEGNDRQREEAESLLSKAG